MIRATCQKRLSALILGLRPTAAHIYGADDDFPVDNLTLAGMASWNAGLEVLRAELADPDVTLTPAEVWMTEWITTETDRNRTRWNDASSVLELLALSLGPNSLDPTHRRPPSYWHKWTQNLHEHRRRLDINQAFPTGDTAALVSHCIELSNTHAAPEGTLALLESWATVKAPVRHQPEVFRPLTTPGERLQLSGMIASAYSIGAQGCSAAEARLLDQRAPLQDCTRQTRPPDSNRVTR